MLHLLAQGQLRLGFSVLHMVELSHPGFKSYDAVCRFLDSHLVSWAVLPFTLLDRELYAGFARSVGSSATGVRAYCNSAAEALVHPELGEGKPSYALDALRIDPKLREMLLAEAANAARAYDTAKREAAAVRTPDAPILSRIRDAGFRQTPSGLHLNRPLEPEEILRRAGGLKGFPSYHLHQALIATRLKDPNYRSKPNDIMDEWHAFYAAYSAVTVLDRATVGRIRSTKSRIAARVTHRLSDVPQLLGLLS
jgi:hypothetical protein